MLFMTAPGERLGCPVLSACSILARMASWAGSTRTRALAPGKESCRTLVQLASATIECCSRVQCVQDNTGQQEYLGIEQRTGLRV